MYGAILGDIIGSVYERDSIKKKDFPLFSKESRFTDDTMMTIAIADALINVSKNADKREIKSEVIRSMRFWGNKSLNAGYGHAFRKWLKSDEPKPYRSYGNGSAMRVSPVGWLYDDLYRTREVARWTAEVTHNHSEGVKGAESVASAIFLARNGKSKEEIKNYIEENFSYDLSRSLDEIRKTYEFEVSCQKSVPESIIAFLESTDFEDAIRNAISLGGDSDTQAAIAGSIAEAFYGVSDELKTEARNRLHKSLIEVLDRFANLIHQDKSDINEPIHLELTSDIINKEFFEDMMYFHAALGGPFCEGYIALLNAKGEFYTGNFLGVEKVGEVLQVVGNGLLNKIEKSFMSITKDLPNDEERTKNGWTYFYLGVINTYFMLITKCLIRFAG